MKKLFTFLCIILFTCVLAAQDKVIELWPKGAPIENGLSGPEVDEGNNRVSNISVAKMYIYMPAKEINTGVAVILLPGGGYRREAMSHEGYEVAEWLKSKGICGIVLKYRLPNGHHQVPLEDASRAIRVTRMNAKEWDLNPNKIGIGGASAGGHLASTAGTRFDLGNANAKDPVEVFSSRPDFMLLLYPLIFFKEEDVSKNTNKLLFGNDNSWETIKKYSSELNVSANTPPAFFVLADNDSSVNPKHSIEFYLALKSFKIQAEMHIFQEGGHGFGITKHDLPVDKWPDMFYSWLKAIKIL
jgi:acetyl esterase/lipase